MHPEEFGKLKHSLAGLTPHQRRQIKDQIHTAERQQAVHLIVESRVAECPACPHCGQGPVARWVRHLACSDTGVPPASTPSTR